MAIPSSGPVSFSTIQSELGGTNPVSISEYYGVGTLPASGTINVASFYGQSLGAGSVSLPTLLNDVSDGTGTVRAQLWFQSDGDIIRQTYSDKTWWSAAPEAGNGSDYNLRITNVSGETPQGITANQWTSLSSGLAIYIETSGSDQILTSQFTLEIQDSTTLTVQASTNCTLFASNSTA